MENLASLRVKREEILERINEIEVVCEGIENNNNAKKMQELNLEYTQISSEKQRLLAELSKLESRLSIISTESAQLSNTGIAVYDVVTVYENCRTAK